MTTEEKTPSSSTNFASEIPSKERSDLLLDLEAFGVRHASHHRPIAVVTSGGTATDLELNSVRCLDNFSTGLRGSISVEEFLKRGYAVIHLWRIGSASPYGRVLSQLIGCQANHGISIGSLGKLFAGDPEEDQDEQLVQSILAEQQRDPWLTDPSNPSSATGTSAGGDGAAGANPNSKRGRKAFDGLALHRRLQNSSRMQTAWNERVSALKEGRLLTVPFRTVEEYLGKLQLCTEAIRDSQSLAILYLAAAVSDFYIPKSERSQHKIQSSDGGLTLNLHPVPKVLKLLRTDWAPDSFVCSFKLETDKDILRQKAERAVDKYGCHMVIGNLLHTRHDEVWILAPETRNDAAKPVQEWPLHDITRPRNSDPDALESLIIDFVVQAHFEYISSSVNGTFDKSGTEAVLRAHQKIEERRKRVQQEIFWKQVKTTALEWSGVAMGAILSYVVSSALRRRMGT